MLVQRLLTAINKIQIGLIWEAILSWTQSWAIPCYLKFYWYKRYHCTPLCSGSLQRLESWLLPKTFMVNPILVHHFRCGPVSTMGCGPSLNGNGFKMLKTESILHKGMRNCWRPHFKWMVTLMSLNVCIINQAHGVLSMWYISPLVYLSWPNSTSNYLLHT